MSYKFQRGAAILSGSIKAEDGLDAGSSGLAAAGAVAGATTIVASGLADVGSITIDNDATIGCNDDSDIITLANQEVSLANDVDFIVGKTGGFNLADGPVTSTAAELNYSDLTTLGSSEASKVVSADVSGDITIVGASANMVWDKSENALEFADNASIEIGTGLDMKLYHDGTNSYIANAVGALKVATETSGIAVTIGHTISEVTVADNLTVAGNLTVQGSTTSVDSTTINISSSFTFEGPADAHETTFHAGTPTTDLTVYLPQFSASAGTQSFYIPALIDAPTDASSKVTAAEFALLDGASSVDTVTVADGDGVMFNAAGAMKHVTVQSLAAYFDDEITAMPNLVSVGTIGTGVWEGTAIASGYIANDAITGAKIALFDDSLLATSQHFLIADGTDYSSFALSGDVTCTNAGVVAISVDAVEYTMLDDNCISGFAELADGDVADVDEMLISDAGTLKRVGADSLKTYFQTGVIADSAGGFVYNTYNATSSVIANADGATGFHVASGSNAASPLSASVNTTLHLSGGAGGWADGMSLFIKAPSNASSFNLTIVASGSERIDGEQSIVLESDYAAVTLLRCHNSRWSIV
jgi:hypothetical protein